MSLPQDDRAPHRQQRWIELHNVGASTIPPFGIVEIVESYRPETYVAGDGPTVVKVRRPTVDSLPHFYINGPTEIPVNKRGKPGTNDYPCLVAYEQQTTPTSGQMWGTIKDSYLAGRGRQGLAIIGDADASLGLVRVNRAERLIRVTPLQGALEPGETELCNVLRWDGNEWVGTSTNILVDDEFFRVCALPGEEFWCESYGESYQPVSEFGLRRRGIVVYNIQANSTGLVNLMSITPAGGGVIPSCVGDRLGPVVDACYRTSGGGTIATNEEVFVHYHPEFRRWFVLPVGSNGLIRFEMKTALPLGGQGTAIEIGTGPAFTQIGVAFPIKDYSRNPGMFRFDPKANSQARGYMGWCVVPANPEIAQDGRPIREIVQMEHIAHSIEFVLTSDLQGTQAQATVTKWYIGKDPSDTNLQSGTGAGAIIVWDDTGNYPHAWEGAKGKARYNDRLHRYEIIECNQMATMLMGYLANDMCPSDLTAAISNFNKMTFAPFGVTKSADSLTGSNVHGLAGQAGDRVTLVWNETTGEWEILNVQHMPIYVAEQVEISASNCIVVITTQLLEIATMSCLHRAEFNDALQFATKDVVTSVEKIDCAIRTTKERVCVLNPSAAVSSNSDIAFTTKSVVTNSRLTSPSGNDQTCKLELFYEDICTLVPEESVGGYVTLIEFEAQLVVQYVEFAAGCFVAYTALVYVACFEEGDPQTIVCGDPCPSGSGSQ